MLNLLADIAPLPRDYDRVIQAPRYVTDTIDSVVGVGQQFSNNVTGGGSSNLPFILGGIIAALVALGFLVFMVRSYRKRGEQHLGFNVVRS